MKKLFMMAIVAMSMMGASAVESYQHAAISVESVKMHAATRVTLHRLTGKVKGARSATAEVIDGEVWVNGKYKARSGDGYGYQYVVYMSDCLYGFNM